jgi:hypothetical protein
MSETEPEAGSFTHEQAILVARAAGLDTADLERQTRQDESQGLQDERLQALEAKLEELSGAIYERNAPQTPEDEDRHFAEHLRDHLNRSIGYGDA